MLSLSRQSSDNKVFFMCLRNGCPPYFKTRTVHFDSFNIRFLSGIDLIHGDYNYKCSCSLDGVYLSNPAFEMGCTFVFKTIDMSDDKPFFYICPWGKVEMPRYVLDSPSFFKECEVVCRFLKRSDIDYIILHVNEDRLKYLRERRLREFSDTDLRNEINYRYESALKIINFIRDNFQVKNELKPSRFRELVLNKIGLIEKRRKEFIEARGSFKKKEALKHLIDAYEVIGVQICMVYNIDWKDVVRNVWDIAEEYLE